MSGLLLQPVPAESPIQRFARERVGTVVGERWVLEAVIGIGGMSSVFSARHRNGNRVAVKLLHPMLALLPSSVQRFVREGYAANLVEHPGVVSVLDDGEVDNIPFIVMELLEGESADDRVERLGTPLSVDQVLAIGRKVLDVLEAAHAKGLVHRDVKPDNIFLTTDGDAKLLDFGVARLGEIAEDSPSATATGSPVGTPSFMSPEQARGAREEIDARTDLYGLGATLFYLLSMQLVHVGTTTSELMMNALSQEARSLAVLRPDLPTPVVALIDKALAYAPELRWESAAAMRAALDAAANDLSLRVPVLIDRAGYVPPPPPPRSAFTSMSGPASQRRSRGEVETWPPEASSSQRPRHREGSGDTPISTPPLSGGRSTARPVVSPPPPSFLPKRSAWWPMALGGIVVLAAAALGRWVVSPGGAHDGPSSPAVSSGRTALPASASEPASPPPVPAATSVASTVAASASARFVPPSVGLKPAKSAASPAAPAPIDIGDSRQ